MEERNRMPDNRGYFGRFGGEYVPETLMYALEELEEGFVNLVGRDAFDGEYRKYLKDYIGRPSPLYYAASLSKRYDVKLYLKREDLNHTGSHKINNALGQVLLAKFLGKKRIIAETGAGQHGVATATACALLGLECHIYMGKVDIERQKLNASRIKLLGGNLIPVETGSMTLKDALNEALRDWTLNVKTTHYVIGSVAGPKPFPKMVREFQKVIGQEAKEQIKLKEGRLPSKLIACVGGGSNAIGLFYEFLGDNVAMYGIEAGGEGLSLRGGHAATLTKGRVGILHGSKSYVLCDEYGQIEDVHSIAAGLDYPGVGPEHSYLKETKRVKYDTITDSEALIGFKMLSEMEGIIPAFESAHALGYMNKLESRMELEREELIIINLSGRGDKDIIWE